MSISYTKVQESEIHKKAKFYGAREFVHVTVNPKSADQYPFPLDYTFPPCFLPKKYLQMHDRIHNFKVRPDDVWVVTFPKSGTTWIMNIVLQLMNDIDLSTEFFDKRQWSLEIAVQADNNDESNNNEAYKTLVENFNKSFHEKDVQPSPRLLKSHLPAHLLPKDIWTVKPKLIYVYRDVKDVVISMYHMYRNSTHCQYTRSMEEFFEAFLNDHVMFGPYFAHIDSFQQLNTLDNVLLLKFEDMLANPFAGVKRINDFLNYSYSDNQLRQLTEHVSFQNMHNKLTIDTKFFPTGFNFFRKGKAGSYRDEMSPEYIQKFDEWEQKHEIKKS